MLAAMDFNEIYRLSGPCGIVLIILGIIAIFLMIYGLSYTTLVWREFKRDFLDEQDAKKRCLREYNGKNPFIMMIRDIIATHSKHSDDLRTEIGYLFYGQFNSVLNIISILKLISVISPLLGLLGTVLGMLDIFRVIAQDAAPSPTLLAGGIWQALVTTVMGLVVAIPSLVAYYLFSLRMKGFHMEAIEHCYRVLEAVKHIDAHEEAKEEGKEQAKTKEQTFSNGNC